MLNISDTLKNLYKNDYFPASTTPVSKKMILYFPEIDLTINTSDTGRVDQDSFSLEEHLCSEQDLTLGSCESNKFTIKIYGLVQDLMGKTFTVTQIINDEYSMPLGKYTVFSIGKQSEMGFRQIEAYDDMKKADKDISAWYNGLTFPITVKNMRQSLLSYLGIEYISQTLTNDSVVLSKTISTSELSGRDILKKIVEINAGFGHIDRTGKFKVIQLSGLGLYPSETLYPAEDLFPSESGEFINAGYQSIDYEEYDVEQITAVKIQVDDDDTGTISGNGDNIYLIMGNYLLFGQNGTVMQSIADNIMLQLKNKFYKPHNTTMIGLPYLEVGDSVLIITQDDAIETFIFNRTLKGIQVLTDEISASGNQKRSTVKTTNNEIQQLKGKTLRIKKSIEELRIDMEDADEGLSSQITLTAGQLQTQITDNNNQLQSQITQTAGQLQTQITDNYNSLSSSITQTASSLQTQITDNKNDLQSQITQQAGQISLKVSKGSVSSEISVESGQITLNSNRLVVNSTKFQLDAAGNATFSGNVSGANITGSTLTSTGSGNGTTTITGGQIKSEGTSYTTTIYNGQINTSVITISQGGGSSVLINGSTVLMTNSDLSIYGGDAYVSGNLTCNTLNGSDPILASNRSQYINILYSSGTAQVTSNGNNFRPHSNYGDDSVSCGSPSYRWTQVFAATPTISTSDENEKTEINSLTDKEKNVANKLKNLIVTFKFKDSVAKKGISSRLHTGIVAQKLKETFESEGLNPYDYAMFCSDTWYEKDGKAVDENENPYTKDDIGVIEVTRLGLRYEELLCFIIGCM